MMEGQFPLAYLSALVLLLGTSAWFLFRQIFKTFKVEKTLSRLEAKLGNEKGTAQEYFELGTIYLEKKLHGQAITQFQKALRGKDLDDPENVAIIHNALGYAYFAQEQYDNAIRQYKDAIKLKPDYVTSLNNLGHAYERKKLTSQALEVYEDVLKFDPKNPTAKRRSDALRRRLVS